MSTSITARVGKGDSASEPITATYDFGATLDEAVEKFGAEVVWSHFLSSATIAAQSRMRAAMKPDLDAGKKPDAKKVQAALDGWTLGEKKPGVSKVEKAKKFVSEMSEEEKQALLKELAG